MEHLNAEHLARLVDEQPTPEEADHLSTCKACSDESDALRSQTEALRALPVMVPPQGDWHVLEARLRSEGLMKDPGLVQRLGFVRTPGWMKTAAALVLFLSGTGTGVALTHADPGTIEPVAMDFANVEGAASAVLVAEQEYVTAVSRYREILAAGGGDNYGGDPVSRFAALEHLVMVSQAAVRQAPGDPFLNGMLASAMAERDVAARMVSSKRDNWF
ncbi:MAG: hypothetical protein OSA81_10885 [Longimicrobiales bacterium]|nr:hypothetical protein [Longimicrobiales bacterium]